MLYGTIFYGMEDELMHIPMDSLHRCIQNTLSNYRPEELDGILTTLWREERGAPFYSKVMENLTL